MGRFVITDLTYFSTERVCMAGLTPDAQHCIRPMPYLTKAEYHNLGIRPGVTVEADFWPHHQADKPHIEDHPYYYGTIHVVKEFDPNILNMLLSASATQSLEDGFGVNAELKHIPLDPANVPKKSIITLEVNPRQFALQYSYDKVKAEFTDQSGCRRPFIPVTDIGINNHINSAPNKQFAINKLNNFIKSQDSLFLRIGIGRPFLYEKDGRHGYWFQVNAAYCFPVLHELIEEY